jgi:putative endonuclease
VVGIMSKQYYVYIMTNRANTVFYTGVTNDLKRRVYDHQQKLVDGFTRRYNAAKLVFFEVCGDIEAAVAREKQIKGGSRRDKIALIKAANEDWHDLGEEL